MTGPTTAIFQKIGPVQRAEPVPDNTFKRKEAAEGLDVSVRIGARLRLFHDNWESITKDRFILKCIKGYKIPLIKKPVQKNFQYRHSLLKNNEIELAVNSLKDKGAIVEYKVEKGQFLSNCFTVPKPAGSVRFIINLKNFNKYVNTVHFKLEDLKTATRLISKGFYMASIDLQDPI